MFRPLPLYMGLRYSTAGSGGGFLSLVTLFSLFGMCLGVTALCVVMSVMNGFEREIFFRTLQAVPHAHINASDGSMRNWRELAGEIGQHPQVTAVSPHIGSEALLIAGKTMQGAQLNAVLTDDRLADANPSLAEALNKMQSGTYGIVLGELLARRLAVDVGDPVNVLLPKVEVTLFGVYPRSRRFRVVDTFSVGTRLDASLAFIHLHDGQRLLRLGSKVHGLQIKVSDPLRAGEIVSELHGNLGASKNLTQRDWMSDHRSLFSAVKMEKTLMGLLLMTVIAVASFNLVAMLAITVEQKRGAIATLSVMGMGGRKIMAIFVCQGGFLGLLGVLSGLALGAPTAFYAGEIVSAVERALGASMFNPDVYFISGIPSDPQWEDFLLIGSASTALSLAATLYPSWQAANTDPAVAIRNV